MRRILPKDIAENIISLDSNKGYESGNVVSCCQKCNTAKGDWLTSEETKVVAEAAIEFRNMAKLNGAK